MSARKVVRFRAGGSEYAVGLEHVVRVEEAEGLSPLPDALPEVAGLLGTTTVLESLGAGGAHVLILDTEAGHFGLRVDEVTEVAQLDEGAFAPAPSGQRGGLFTGRVEGALLLDPGALAGRLTP